MVLLSPDNQGSEKRGTLRPRARQNILLELGYFISRLGRSRVCVLKRDDVEIPSDFAGVVYEQFDDGAPGKWRGGASYKRLGSSSAGIVFTNRNNARALGGAMRLT